MTYSLVSNYSVILRIPNDLSLVLLYVQNDFGLSKLFWTGTNCFGQVQIILVMFKLDFSGLIFIIWTCPKCFGPNQNDLGPSKTIGTRPKLSGQSKIILDP